MSAPSSSNSFRFSIVLSLMKNGRMNVYGVQAPHSSDFSQEIRSCDFHHILTYRRSDGQILATVDIFAQQKIILIDAERAASSVLGLRPSQSIEVDEWNVAFFCHPWDEILSYVERAYLDME